MGAHGKPKIKKFCPELSEKWKLFADGKIKREDVFCKNRSTQKHPGEKWDNGKWVPAEPDEDLGKRRKVPEGQECPYGHNPMDIDVVSLTQMGTNIAKTV